MATIHQINHPGQELIIRYKNCNKYKDDYKFNNNSINEGIRYWNRYDAHKRKFIESYGKYVDNFVEKSATLYFWGEYEGFSEFELLQWENKGNYWEQPCAIHKPFFFNQKINKQNTDPFIFGDNWYYAICKKNKLKNIQNNDIILFGSEFGSKDNEKFYLDTLFVVKQSLSSIIDKTLYDDIYIESTLTRIGINSCSKGNLPIHTAQNFSNNNSIFSFFPATIDKNSESFGKRPHFDADFMEKLGLQKPGARTGCKSRKLTESENIIDIWKTISNKVIEQGFVLGTYANKLNFKSIDFENKKNDNI